MEDKRVYVTRDTNDGWVHVYPATVGIRKFHGCVEYGAAWQKDFASCRLGTGNSKYREYIPRNRCRERYGFYPGEGTAWYINQRGKRTRVLLAFSGK